MYISVSGETSTPLSARLSLSHRRRRRRPAGLIPLQSSHMVQRMKTIYEPAEDDDIIDVVLTLDVRCTGDETLSVTSDDLHLDPNSSSEWVCWLFGGGGLRYLGG